MPFDKEEALRKASEAHKIAQERLDKAQEKEKQEADAAQAVRTSKRAILTEHIEPEMEEMRQFLSNQHIDDAKLRKSEGNQSNPNATLSWTSLSHEACELMITASGADWSLRQGKGTGAHITGQATPDDIKSKLWETFTILLQR